MRTTRRSASSSDLVALGAAFSLVLGAAPSAVAEEFDHVHLVAPEPRVLDAGHRIAFVEGPEGTKIELVEILTGGSP